MRDGSKTPTATARPRVLSTRPRTGDIAYSNGTLTFPPGSPQNGVFTATIGNTSARLSFPLVPGIGELWPQGTSSSLGTFTGTSFLSADNTFFYANITPTSQPTQRLFISGGMPANPAAFQQTGSTRMFAFSVQPDAALQSNIPFIRSQAGGNLPNATVSPLYVVAPPTTPIGDSTTLSAARALQASLAINGQGANQQSTIAVTTGTIDAMQSNGQPILNGHLRGSSLQSAGGTPVRVGSAVGSTVDGAGNSFYGGELDLRLCPRSNPGSLAAHRHQCRSFRRRRHNGDELWLHPAGAADRGAVTGSAPTGRRRLLSAISAG